jgi:hypothetical protein
MPRIRDRKLIISEISWERDGACVAVNINVFLGWVGDFFSGDG